MEIGKTERHVSCALSWKGSGIFWDLDDEGYQSEIKPTINSLAPGTSISKLACPLLSCLFKYIFPGLPTDLSVEKVQKRCSGNLHHISIPADSGGQTRLEKSSENRENARIHRVFCFGFWSSMGLN